MVDRLVVKEGIRPRLTDSVETALREGKGTLIVAEADKEQQVGPGIDPEEYKRHDRFFSEQNACHACGLSFGELAPQNFSFNSPLGSCPDCQGLGTRAEMDPDLIVPDPSLTIRDGAVEPWASGHGARRGLDLRVRRAPLPRASKLDLDTPWGQLPKRDRDLVLLGSEAVAGATRGSGSSGRAWSTSCCAGSSRPPPRPCGATTCATSRTSPARPATASGSSPRAARSASTASAASSSSRASPSWRPTPGWPGSTSRGTRPRIADELLKEIRNRLRFLLDVGLGYLTLDRPGPSLSGGESQRIRLASQMGSELTGVIYILDEPSIGLHQRDNGKLLATLKRLRDIGNSVIVVEHDEETMEEADWLVDFGPGAGAPRRRDCRPGHAGRR